MMPQPNIFSASASKLGHFASKLDAWRRGEAVVPITLEIHPSERCNHRCPECQARYALPLSDVRRRAKSGALLDVQLIHEVLETPPDGIVLSGNTGDPLLHPEIGEIIESIGKRRIPLVLITNGEALSPSVARAAVRACSGIRISLDAADADSFRLSHGMREDSWLQVLYNVRQLIRIRVEEQAHHCQIGLGYLTGATTRGSMVSATRLAQDIGVDYIQFRPFHFDTERIEAEAEECRRLATPSFRVLSSDQKYVSLGTRQRTYNQCHGAGFYSVLDARGDLYLCCHHVGNDEARWGSLQEARWIDLIASRARREHVKNFDVARCVPLCRLNAHNEALEQYLVVGAIPPPSQDPLVRAHAAFL